MSRRSRHGKLSTLEDDPLLRGGSNSDSRYSSSSVSFQVAGPMASTGASKVSCCSSPTSSGESAKVTFFCFVRGCGGVGERFNIEVLVDGRQYEESSVTSKSRYFVSVRSSTLEPVFSLVPPFETTGEPVLTWWDKGSFPNDPDLGECVGDGVSLVRSIVSGMSYIVC